MVKFYAYHGTDEEGFEGIGDGDWDRGGLIDDFCVNETYGHIGALGRGIYATTYYHKARGFGEYVYLMGFHLKQLKVVDEWDYETAWKAPQGQYYCDAVYMPSEDCGGCPQRDEFCFRGETLAELYIIRTPGCQADNWHFEKPHGLREQLEYVLEDQQDFPFFMYNLKWSEDELCYNIYSDEYDDSDEYDGGYDTEDEEETDEEDDDDEYC